MDKTQEEMSLGDGDILKFSGICPGGQRWKRCVRMSSGGAFDVEGTLFGIVYKRRSEEACGFVHRGRGHWIFALSFDNSTSLLPSCRSKAGDEEPHEKLLSVWGWLIEERVMAPSGFGAEAEPACPGLVV